MLNLHTNTVLRRVIKDRDTVIRRSGALQKAVEQYDESVQELVKAAEVTAKSIKLSKVDMAKLLGLSRAHLYKMPGVDITRCKTYADLYRQIAKNRPELVDELDENFERFLRKTKNKK